MTVAQAAGLIGPLGTLVSAVAGVLAVLLTVVTWWVRRQSAEARDARKLRDTNLAALRWYYRVSAVAAIKGWDTDPAWPKVPKEMTAEYLAEQTQEDPAGPLAQLAEAAKELRQR